MLFQVMVCVSPARSVSPPLGEVMARVVGLAAMELSEKGLLEDRFPTFVMKEPTERRAQLVRRNHLPAHFDTMVITNECELS